MWWTICVCISQMSVGQWRYSWLLDIIFNRQRWTILLHVFDLPLGWYEQAVDWWHWAGCQAQSWLSERWPAPRTSAEIKILLSFKSQEILISFCVCVCVCAYFTCWAACTCWTTWVGTPVCTTAGGGLESDTLSLEWREPSEGHRENVNKLLICCYFPSAPLFHYTIQAESQTQLWKLQLLNYKCRTKNCVARQVKCLSEQVYYSSTQLEFLKDRPNFLKIGLYINHFLKKKETLKKSPTPQTTAIL